MGYMEVSGGFRCGKCAWMKMPNRCGLVVDPKDPDINPDDGCCLSFVQHPKGVKEAHTSTSMYGRNMNAELDEDSYLKQALAYLSAAVKAHNMEDQRPEMEAYENDFLMAAKSMLDNAVRVHTRETKTLEIITLDDIPKDQMTPTHGSSQTNNISIWGGNADEHEIWAIIRAYLELKNRGIPDKEALRAIAMQFGIRFPHTGNTQYEPRKIPNPYHPYNTNYWPLKPTGAMDNAGREWIDKIPSGPFSPSLPPHFDPPQIEAIAISGSLSNISIGGNKNNEELVLPSLGGITKEFSIHSFASPDFPKLPPLLDNTNYMAASGNNNKDQPASIHGEQGWVPSKQIPEESYYDPMNKSWSKRKSGQPPQTSNISTQITYGDSVYAPQDNQPGESEAVVPRNQILPAQGSVIEPGTKEQIMGMEPPIKLRQMGKFHYSGHGELSKYQERRNNHICEQLNGTIWDMSDRYRPILPSEGAGITSTHPNCLCTWQYFTEVDPDPLAYAMTRKPTLNGQSLEDFKWKGKAIDHIERVNNLISDKYQMGTLHKLNKDGSVGGLMECQCGCKKHKTLNKIHKLRESMLGFRESLLQEFRWITPEYLAKIKDMEREVGGKFYLVRASAETITDHRSEGEPYRRKLDSEELWATARTGIGKGTDINHDPRYKTDGYVVDGDFDPIRKEVQYIVHESDPEVIRAIDNRVITAVSINGGAPRLEFVAPCEDGCESSECELCLHPRGVILGEEDNIAFTWVVTSPQGMKWHGIHMNAASPGVKLTKIEPL